MFAIAYKFNNFILFIIFKILIENLNQLFKEVKLIKTTRIKSVTC